MIEVITKVVTAGSIIGAGLWTLVTFVETRRTEVETRNREITKPFREAQLKMCDELTIQAARFVRTVDDPVPHTLDIQFFHNEAEQMRGTAARAEFLGDRRLALLAMSIASAGFSCGWDRALAAREPERGKKFEEEPHRGRKFCQACLTYLQFLIAERCFDLMRSWWVEPQVERLDGGGKRPRPFELGFKNLRAWREDG